MIKSILGTAVLASMMFGGAAVAAETYDLGGAALGVPSVVWYKPAGNDAVAVFVRGKDGHMYAQVGDGEGSGWTGWAAIGDLTLKSDPACVATSGTVIDCVAMGPNNNIFHIRHNAKAFTWTKWENLGGAGAAAPGIARTVDEDGNLMLDVFVEGPGNLLFLNAFDGDEWSDWQNLEVTVGGAVACTDILVVGAHCYDTSGGTAVQYSDLTRNTGSDILLADLGGQVNGKAAPVVSGKKGNNLHVFVNGPGKRLWVKTWDGEFSDWTQLPVAIGSGAPGCGVKKSGGDVWCAVVDGGNGPVTAIQIGDDEL